MKFVFIFFIVIKIGILSSNLYGQESEVFYSYKVGDFKVSLLSEAQWNGRIDILIGATSEILQQCAPDSVIQSAMCAYLVQTPDQTILFDAGLGQKLFERMESMFVDPKDVNIVMLTHMHGDHIGGMLLDNKKSFPNATVYLSEPEYDYWTSDEELNRFPENQRGGFNRARQVINAYKNKLKLFKPGQLGEKQEFLLPGIQGIAAYGHTPGHTVYLLESKQKQLLIWGDLTHAMAVQMPYPQIAVTYDVDPKLAVKSRLAILNYVEKHQIPIAGMHIAYPGMGTIQPAPKEGYIFTPFTP